MELPSSESIHLVEGQLSYDLFDGYEFVLTIFNVEGLDKSKLGVNTGD